MFHLPTFVEQPHDSVAGGRSISRLWLTSLSVSELHERGGQIARHAPLQHLDAYRQFGWGLVALPSYARKSDEPPFATPISFVCVVAREPKTYNKSLALSLAVTFDHLRSLVTAVTIRVGVLWTARSPGVGPRRRSLSGFRLPR